MSTTYRPIDSKREEFRKYLESTGVMDALTKVLVLLYEEPEKPEDALEFIRTNLGGTHPTTAEIDAMRRDLAEFHTKLELLQKENNELKMSQGAQLPSFESSTQIKTEEPDKTQINDKLPHNIPNETEDTPMDNLPQRDSVAA